MLGDNNSAVDSKMNPHRKIRKRHVALSFHRVRETIAASVISIVFHSSSLKIVGMLSWH